MFALCSARQKEGLLCPSVEPDPAHLAIDHMGLDKAFGVMENDSIGTRTIAGVLSRFLLPVMVLWLYGLATGEGYSVKFFTLPLLTDTLVRAAFSSSSCAEEEGLKEVAPAADSVAVVGIVTSLRRSSRL